MRNQRLSNAPGKPNAQIEIGLTGLPGFLASFLSQVQLNNIHNFRITNQPPVSNNTLQGTVSLSRFSLRNETGIVKVTDSDLSDLAILCSELLENLFNTALENGFPIPLPPVVQLDNVDVEILNRNVFINADFRLEKRALGDLIVRAIFGVMDNMS
uniref:BPI2 domain-containing protein n=1 Tax=Steinernema glaseri TaxID=37863 RepID=A0A1I7YR87_9BILA